METSTSVCAVLVAAHSEAAKPKAMMSRRGINLLARRWMRSISDGAEDTTARHLPNNNDSADHKDTGDQPVTHKKAARRPLLERLITLN